MGKKITTIAEEFMEVLAQHSWPGNVRELQNFIERSVILSEGGVLTGSSPNPARIAHEAPKEPTPTTLEQVERSHILKVLEETEGVVGGRNGAAARLGMRRTTLIYRLRRMGIHLGQSSTSPMSAAESSLSVSKELGADTLPLSETSDETAGSNFTEARCRAKRVCTLAEAEREHISEVVEMKNGLIAGKGGAAEVLGVPPSTLRNRMKKLGIEFSGPASLNAAG
jgi:formate hydrogenlyase transcriptional activator